MALTLDQMLAERTERSGECVVWIAGITKRGYGNFIRDKKNHYVHRAVWEQANGPIPGGLFVDHKCHNRACCNIDHLRLVTASQNAQNRSGTSRSNTSGYHGVSWDKRTGRWDARVKFEGKQIFLGRFLTAAEAGEAARLKRVELFTHNDIDRQAVTA